MPAREIDTLPLVLTVQETAKVLKISRNTTYELVRSGKLHSVRIGHQIRIPREAITEFLYK